MTLSPSAECFVDVYSTPDTPPVAELRTSAGALALPLEKADISKLTGDRLETAATDHGQGA